MAEHEYRRLLVAYTWFGTRVLTPRWFDNNEFSRPWSWTDTLWARMRSWGWIRLRYWGRATDAR